MLLTVLRTHAQTRPDQIALQAETFTLRYAELLAEIQHAADLLTHTYTRCLALAMDNTPAWVIWDLAALQSGVTHVPVPVFFSPAQKTHAVHDAGADLLITDQPEQWLGWLPEAERLQEYVLGGTLVTLLRLPAYAVTRPATVAKITYTSGTTGQPKGVCLSARAMEAVAQSVCEQVALTPADKHLCVLPLATLLENVAGVYAMLLAGGTVVIPTSAQVGFTGSQCQIALLHACMARYATQTAILIPELLRGLVRHLQQGAVALPGLRFLAVGGAHVSSAMLAEAQQLGLPVYEGYGLSECASVVTLNTPAHHLPGSIGKPLPHVALKLAEDGELWIRGETFTGYTQSGGLVSAMTDTQGYYASGDLARVDAQGYWFIIGRKKNMFITSLGRNISPEWIENSLLGHAHIAQVCVFGEAKPMPVALIVAQASASAIAEAVAATNQQLPDYARIGAWLRSDTPFTAMNGMLTANGRMKRDAIWHHYQPALEALYQAS